MSINEAIIRHRLKTRENCNNLKKQIIEMQQQLESEPVPVEPAAPAEPAAPEPAVQVPAEPAVQVQVPAEPAVQVQVPVPAAQASKTKKAASSFDTPEKISEEFALFIGLQGGKEISRTAANKHILNYIKRNNLQDKTNPKRILPDEKLTKLLRLQEVKEELTYFNIHKYIHSHFTK